ncbi:MAG TPA: hypothetical protein VND64_35325 [Pirellulales bacterium]|nr:hypothetical protein [Pirellulales bacterium]
MIVCAIALRRAFNIKTNEYDDPDSWFKNRMLIENFRLNFLAIDDEDLESLITKSGCDRGLSARHMQKHIRRWLITNSADPASEVAAQERIARYGFGWLGEPGDQSLDTFHAYLGLASGETVADLLDGALPGAVNFELGGIPLTPVHRTR